MADQTTVNVCSYKPACKSCVFVTVENRPSLCKLANCEQYTPCVRCSRNRPLNDLGLCSFCVRFSEKGAAAQEVQNDLVEKKMDEITEPGTPPSSYNESERSYYVAHWDEYAGYYRDPTVYAVVHQLILMEVELARLQAMCSTRGGEAADAILSRREKVLRLWLEVRKSLPEKDAADLSQDEKSMACIYEAYLKEKGVRYRGGVSRMISHSAIALNHVLPFQVDLNALSEMMGWKLCDYKEAAKAWLDDGMTTIQVVERLGFPIHEVVIPLDTEAETFRESATTEENGPTEQTVEVPDFEEKETVKPIEDSI